MNYYPKLLSYTIEIEGLLRVMQQNPSQEAADMLVEKIDAFNALYYEASTVGDNASEITQPIDKPREPQSEKPAEEEPQQPVKKEIRTMPETEYITGVNGLETDLHGGLEAIVSDEDDEITDPNPEAADERAEAAEEAEREASCTEIRRQAEEAARKTEMELEAERQAEMKLEAERQAREAERQAEMKLEVERQAKEAERQPREPMRLDEVLTKREFSDLDKAITLNDRFRFTRELFGGSDSLYRQTIATLKSIPTLEEAREYLLFDLGFDAQNENVADFLEIIENHYSAR